MHQVVISCVLKELRKAEQDGILMCSLSYAISSTPRPPMYGLSILTGSIFPPITEIKKFPLLCSVKYMWGIALNNSVKTICFTIVNTIFKYIG